ncbi:alpha-2-macroglobulin isoform X2 [Amia ocellicauda]|uniref:alpha-2-macroglobulin isoform X2 n=1 Tax=Amia ocellicauda TaxID=2972642 RepID=UPI0034641988
MLGALLLAALVALVAHTALSEPIFMVTLTSQAIGGSTETLCAQLLYPKGSLLFTVTLETESSNITLLEEQVKAKEFYRCLPFQVPSVTVDTTVTIHASVQGNKLQMHNQTKFLISPNRPVTFMQTDKPIYKPGQTVKFRIVSLDTSFLPINQVFPTVELQDPSSNRIAQWLNRSSTTGILDFSLPMSPEAIQGSYHISAWNEKNEQMVHLFEIKEYVLPKYEVKVNLPAFITILDTEAPFKVCGKYTYGKPVLGNVRAEVCRKPYRYYWLPNANEISDLCKKFDLTTDKTGCASGIIDLSGFALNKTGYQDIFELKSQLEEDGTGVILEGSGSSTFTSDVLNIKFENLAKAFMPGIPFEGKIKVTRPDSSPVASELIKLSVGQNPVPDTMNLTTDSDGSIDFSLDTSSWKLESISLSAKSSQEVSYPYESGVRRPMYGTAFALLKPFYSKSNSFLKIQQADGELSCEKDETIIAQYIIQGEELKNGQHFIDFFYLVMSKGSLVRHGRVEVVLSKEKVQMGELSFTLKRTEELAPVAQVVVYTVLPDGEAVADSFDFAVQKCFKNKVSLKFSSSQELPGEHTTLDLQAEPGSLCALRAIDQSVLLLKAEQELSVDYVYGQLPVQKMSGYPYRANEEDVYQCFPRPLALQKRSLFMPYDPKYDVYGIFRDVGVKLLTNSDVKKPLECLFTMWPEMHFAAAPGPALDASPMAFLDTVPQLGSSLPENSTPKQTVRTFFPETWIWDLVSVGESGSVQILQTVPDTITKWEAGAFCTSSLGFGLSPSTDLTAFQPFFVSLTLPYSVIRGEVFELKATVFNYLPECIMVKVSLAGSQQFKAQDCNGCQYTLCLCAEESKTFTWMVTPTALGQVNISVSAEALQTEDLCGNEVATVPERGRIDTVIQSLLVEAEGTEQTKSNNALLCPADGPVKEHISLKVPDVMVQGSARASLSVLGDILGRAMKNLDRLLAMPYGCGEQNMLLFAPNIYILKYLQSTGQLTDQIKSTAIRYLEGGYQRELNYKHDDGSYSAFGKSDESGNTWLTAFVLKSFGSARSFIFIDPAHISEARSWLSKLQMENGCFRSVGKLFHNAMKGGVSDEVTLTAYITAAMLELDNNLTDPVVLKGLSCLRTATENLTSTYATALLSYTFTLAGDEAMRTTLVKKLNSLAKTQSSSLHWTRSEVEDKSTVDSLDVEMTSYVLLALLSGPTLPDFGLGYSSSIVRWLAQQQNPYGGFSSTQDTVVALHALALYGAVTFSPEGSSTVTVRSAGGYQRVFNIDNTNRLLYQEEALQEIPGEYSLEAQGKSCVFVQIALHYNIPPPPDFSAFTIAAKAEGVCNGTGNRSLNVSVAVKYNGKREETNMVIINVKLLSGFVLDKDSLASLRSQRFVKRIDTEEGHVIIYLDGLVRMAPQVYSLSILEDVPVRNLKPAVVKIYDYYQTSDAAVSAYSSPCAEEDTKNQV